MSLRSSTILRPFVPVIAVLITLGWAASTDAALTDAAPADATRAGMNGALTSAASTGTSPTDTATTGNDPSDTVTTGTAPSGAGPIDSTTTTVPPATQPAPPTTVATDDRPADANTDDTVVDRVVDDPVRRPAFPASVRSSDIPIGSIAMALLVLGAVATASVVLARGRPRTEAQGGGSPSAIVDGANDPTARRVTDAVTVEFLIGLGQALIDAGDAVSHVESTLRAVARVNGIDGLGVIVFPTALVVSVPGDDNVTTEVNFAGRASLRLDQVDDVLALVGEAERGLIGAVEGQRRLDAIRASPPMYSFELAVLGYVCSTVGIAAILRAPVLELALAAVLGALVGSFRLSTRRLTAAYQPFVPLVAATAVSTSVFAMGRVIGDLQTFPLLISPLITFLPGALLTIGVLELATGQNVSGVSRLASGVVQLVLLALGLVAGSELVGVPAGDLGARLDGPVGAIVPWVGVGVFGAGVVWFNGARASARIWIVLVLYVAYSGQVIGGLFFGSALSSFFGALAMTPVAIVAARQASGPTPLVTFLPGFWILVPGALGLDGVTGIIGAGSSGGALITTVISMVGISLGILLGLLVAADDPERPWAQTSPTPRS